MTGLGWIGMICCVCIIGSLDWLDRYVILCCIIGSLDLIGLL